MYDFACHEQAGVIVLMYSESVNFTLLNFCFVINWRYMTIFSFNLEHFLQL